MITFFYFWQHVHERVDGQCSFLEAISVDAWHENLQAVMEERLWLLPGEGFC